MNPGKHVIIICFITCVTYVTVGMILMYLNWLLNSNVIAPIWQFNDYMKFNLTFLLLTTVPVLLTTFYFGRKA
jgi:hypothetical protein